MPEKNLRVLNFEELSIVFSKPFIHIDNPKMTSNFLEILPFCQEYQVEIEMFVERISDEFLEPISSTKTLNKLETTELGDKYLVALVNKKVVGTIRLTILNNDNSVLRRMFLDKDFRGKDIANLLLESITNWAFKNKLKRIYLGTMTQFKAAQSFYENNNFEKIAVKDLPNDFPINPVDSIFYRKNLLNIMNEKKSED